MKIYTDAEIKLLRKHNDRELCDNYEYLKRFALAFYQIALRDRDNRTTYEWCKAFECELRRDDGV